MANAAQTVKRLQLELGGKSATIVLDDVSEDRERVESSVQSGLEEGAELLLGGKRPAHLPKGLFFEPTVFINARNDMRIAQEEWRRCGSHRSCLQRGPADPRRLDERAGCRGQGGFARS